MGTQSSTGGDNELAESDVIEGSSLSALPLSEWDGKNI